MDTSRKKIDGLQVIRGGAALLVMLYHYTSRYNDIIYLKAHSSWPINVSWGCYAVIMFFLISGFLTAYNIVNQESPGRFIKKRIKLIGGIKIRLKISIFYGEKVVHLADF